MNPNKPQIREYLVEVNSLNRDIDKYPSCFQFQVPLRDTYKNVVKVELLKAHFFVPSLNTVSSTNPKYIFAYPSYSRYETELTTFPLYSASNGTDLVSNLYNGMSTLYLTIDELRKGNLDSENVNINNAFCSFNIDARNGIDSWKSFDKSNDYFPSTIYQSESPLPGLSKLTVTLHPEWSKLPFPAVNVLTDTYSFDTYKVEDEATKFATITENGQDVDIFLKKVVLDSTTSGSYSDYVRANKTKYLLQIEVENYNRKQKNRVSEASRKKNWGNTSVNYKSINNAELHRIATKDNFLALSNKKQNYLLFKITCATPVSNSIPFLERPGSLTQF